MGKITIVHQFKNLVGSGFVFLLLETPDLFFLFFPGPKKVTFRFFSWKDNPDFFLVKTARYDIFWSTLNSDFAVLFLWENNIKFLVLIFFARTCRPKATNLQMPRQTQRPPSSGCCGCAPCTCDRRLWPSQQCWKAWLGKSSLVN